ncbi:MAG TPA: DUF1761 domain-containing protein [Gammaproteobacteria bacterium]|nr:DUF1761 domain-containing protein [Gammaproteobacteria bacterium]
MSTGWFLAAVISAAVLSSLSDWFFGGILFHKRYRAHPEIWRITEGKRESLAIAWSTLLGVLTCAVFIYLAARLNTLSWMQVLGLALGIWLLAPLPMLITNGLFIKIHPLNTLSNAFGWLVKLLICAVATHLFLG